MAKVWMLFLFGDAYKGHNPKALWRSPASVAAARRASHPMAKKPPRRGPSWTRVQGMWRKEDWGPGLVSKSDRMSVLVLKEQWTAKHRVCGLFHETGAFGNPSIVPSRLCPSVKVEIF